MELKKLLFDRILILNFFQNMDTLKKILHVLCMDKKSIFLLQLNLQQSAYEKVPSLNQGYTNLDEY